MVKEENEEKKISDNIIQTHVCNLFLGASIGAHSYTQWKICEIHIF